MRLRNRVRDARKQRSLTQEALADLAAISTQTLSDIEQDDGHEPRTSVQRRICEVLQDPTLFWLEQTADDAPVTAPSAARRAGGGEL